MKLFKRQTKDVQFIGVHCFHLNIKDQRIVLICSFILSIELIEIEYISKEELEKMNYDSDRIGRSQKRSFLFDK